MLRWNIYSSVQHTLIHKYHLFNNVALPPPQPPPLSLNKCCCRWEHLIKISTPASLRFPANCATLAILANTWFSDTRIFLDNCHWSFQLEPTWLFLIPLVPPTDVFTVPSFRDCFLQRLIAPGLILTWRYVEPTWQLNTVVLLSIHQPHLDCCTNLLKEWLTQPRHVSDTLRLTLLAKKI